MANRGGGVLCIDVLPFASSTRTRKMALSIKEALPRTDVQALTLQRVGRTGLADLRRGYEEGGVAVHQVPSLRPFTRRTRAATVGNLLLVYPPSLVRLAWEALRRPARVVVLGSTSLCWLGALHQAVHGSHVVVSARERLGGVRTRGSIGTLVSRLEPRMMRFLGRRDVTTVAVCDGHADEFARAGAHEVLTVRNVPRRDFIPDRFPPPPDPQGPLTLVLLGSLYEGRGVEPLIRAVARARLQGHDVRLEITGRASPEYLGRIRSVVRASDIEGHVRYLGPCEPDEVAERYARGHVGTALYEAVDRANDSLSNKLFECVASGRPVLAGDLPENRRVVEEHGLGWTAPVDEQALAERIGEIAASAGTLEARGRRCQDVSRRELHWEAEIGPLVERVGRYVTR
ncbi:glycosyltransferase [Mumia sp. DW29H23]|uniref:glycosyltransferase n=1 Tax=Mumia sp. DW29H23 TaxID=3421241 RepID=UPI003D6892BF